MLVTRYSYHTRTHAQLESLMHSPQVLNPLAICVIYALFMTKFLIWVAMSL